MKRKIKISAVQMKVLSAKKTLPKILDYIKKASKEKSDIVCFPECSFNWSAKNPSLEKDLALIREQCRKGNIFVVINGYFKNKNNDVYNRTYLIDGKGKISGFYDKIYLWESEMKEVEWGKDVKVIKTPLGKLGFITCWDLFFPELLEKLKKLGAEIIFCPSYWEDNLKKEAEFLECAPIVFAYQYMAYFIYCNAALKGKTSVSQIASPWGGLKKIKYKEGMISADIYLDRLERFKNNFKNAFYNRKL